MEESHGTQRTLVVKVGSSTLTTSESQIDYAYMDKFADQIAAVRAMGWRVVVVTSASIACGLEALGMTTRPNDMPSLQAAASVGQGALAAAYAQAFRRHDIITSLVLLTRRDTADRSAYLHARDTLTRLLELGVVPVVNENDSISVEQIRFGDNDTLSALVACLIKADLDIILSDVEGLYDDNPRTNPDAKLIERVDVIDERIMNVAGGTGTVAGSGGMKTKIKAARVLAAAGIPLIICHGRRDNVIIDAVSGKSVGTLFTATEKKHEITPRKLWIALGDSSRGSLIVDDGAYRALVKGGSSLLMVGVKAVTGSFAAGDIVDIKEKDGRIVARGRVSASRDEIELAVGKTHEELKRNKLLSNLADHALVHRDELIVFE